jgi:hypothetical protein
MSGLAEPPHSLILTLECPLLPVLDLTEVELFKTSSCIDSSLVASSADRFLPVSL